jgi:hypothetical protein
MKRSKFSETQVSFILRQVDKRDRHLTASLAWMGPRLMGGRS